MRLKTSIIIPCHNYGKFLSWAIQSALHQSWPAKEIIVINDSSSDNTELIATKFGNLIRYFSVDFSCAQQTRNFALSQAKGEYILFLDADDFLDNQALELLEIELNADKKLKLVYSGGFYFGTPEIVLNDDFKFFRIPGDFDLRRLQNFNYIPMPSLFRKSGFPGFDPEIKRFQDWEAWLSFLSSNSDAKCVRLPLHHVRFHGKNKTLNVNYFSERFKILAKHELLKSYLIKFIKSQQDAIIVNKDDLNSSKLFIVALSVDIYSLSALLESLRNSSSNINGVIVQTKNEQVIQKIKDNLADCSFYLKFETQDNLDELIKSFSLDTSYQQSEWLVFSDFSATFKFDELTKCKLNSEPIIVSPIKLIWSQGLKQKKYFALNRKGAQLAFPLPFRSDPPPQPKKQHLTGYCSNLWGKYVGWRFRT